MDNTQLLSAHPSDLVSRFPRRVLPSTSVEPRRESKPLQMRPTSAIPTHYYAVFAIYEPCLTTLGFLGALLDPKGTHDYQAPWPTGSPPDGFPLATKLTITQLGHVCALLGLLNVCILTQCRVHLSLQPALQEKIVSALLTPLLIGDFLHIYLTLWALGDQRWDFQNWSPMLIITVLFGFTLLVPRVMWQLGIGRYVDSRDGHGHNNPKS
ncbi:hypothetical protein B0H17DRAFT_1090930 [Mycena rosella]|uniref:DUF7704 domain-containing protein n=1 Tax=Mycena rosella TaxID=1033263 RepID=A0AAD7G424_MYCRO|nr:hypothetical protein B0H17DRAFT_1090930 [Mycena rosella]